MARPAYRHGRVAKIKGQRLPPVTPSLAFRAQCSGGGAGGSGGRVGDSGQRLLVVRGGDEPCLEGGGRKVDAPVEHGVEEGGVRGGRLVLCITEIPHRLGTAKEDGEQAARRGQVVRDAFLLKNR